MRTNPLKPKLLAGGTSFGLFAFEFFTPGLPQIAKEAGAEFLLLDMEHSGAGIDTIKQQLRRAVQGFFSSLGKKLRGIFK